MKDKVTKYKDEYDTEVKLTVYSEWLNIDMEGWCAEDEDDIDSEKKLKWLMVDIPKDIAISLAKEILNHFDE